jgi:hypothetical protein
MRSNCPKSELEWPMPSLPRRALLTGALAAAALPGLASATIPPSGLLRFNILRNGRPIGQYVVTFVTNGTGLHVTTEATMLMRIAGVTVLDYNHHCEEIWRGGQFMELHSRTRRDRVTQFVNATRIDYGINIDTQEGRNLVPAYVNPLSHWNPSVFRGRMFNPQDGATVNVISTNVGRETTALANGSKVGATHWTLRGDAEIDDWYDDAGVWVALSGVLPDHSTIQYLRV